LKKLILTSSLCLAIAIGNVFAHDIFAKHEIKAINPRTANRLYVYTESTSVNDTIPVSVKKQKREDALNGIANNFNYFQNGLDSSLRIVMRPLEIKPNDVIAIQFASSSLNQEQVSFLKYGGAGATDVVYLVDESGIIKIPIIGAIMAAGKTRAGLADTLEQILREKELVKGPLVQVRFVSIKISVMGDVGSPGIKTFSSDRITLIDAILACGGVNETGIKNDVRIIREVDGAIKVIHVNLVDAGFIGSSAYQLEQNDIVYVDADNVKLKQLKRGKKTFMRDFTTGISLVSSLFLILNIINLFK
jgi:polysaccharide export outer membrane protein